MSTCCSQHMSGLGHSIGCPHYLDDKIGLGLGSMRVEKLKGDERRFTLSAKAQRRRDLEKKSKKNYVHPSVQWKQEARDYAEITAKA